MEYRPLAGDRANLSELDTSFSLLHSAVSYQVVKHFTCGPERRGWRGGRVVSDSKQCVLDRVCLIASSVF